MHGDNNIVYIAKISLVLLTTQQSIFFPPPPPSLPPSPLPPSLPPSSLPGQNNPLLSFLRFHEEFTLRHNYDDCRNYLQEMELNADKVAREIF